MSIATVSFYCVVLRGSSTRLPEIRWWNGWQDVYIAGVNSHHPLPACMVGVDLLVELVEVGHHHAAAVTETSGQSDLISGQSKGTLCNVYQRNSLMSYACRTGHANIHRTTICQSRTATFHSVDLFYLESDWIQCPVTSLFHIAVCSV